MSETTHRALRLALASLLLVALLAQLAIGMSRADLTVVNFVSYFTILSNLAAVVSLFLLAVRPQLSSSGGFSIFRGAVTVYMSATGVVYAVVLAPTALDVGLTEPWVNWSLHVVGPVAMALDWVFFIPETVLPTTAPLVWLIFPAAYLAYSLIRGAFLDWYPYPFLDPSQTDGYPGVAMWSAVVLAIILVFGYGYYWWSSRRTAPATA